MVAGLHREKARAREALDTGRHRDAARLLEGVVERAPEEWPAVLQLGDLYTRLGRKGPANALYRRLADHYEEEGHHARAAALWQKILRNDPTFLGAHLKLGGLYGELGRRVDARRHYETALAEYRKRGRDREADMVEVNLAGLKDAVGRPYTLPADSSPNVTRRPSSAEPSPPVASGPALPSAEALPGVSPTSHSEGAPTGTSPEESTARESTAEAAHAAREPESPVGSAGEAEFLEERLLQGRMFRRYGLLTQARSELELVLERFPENVEAREELREVLRDQGDHQAAVVQQRHLDATKAEPDPAETPGVGDLAGLEAVLASEPPEIAAEDLIPTDLIPIEIDLLPPVAVEESPADEAVPVETPAGEPSERQSAAQLAVMLEDFRRGVDAQVEGDDFETRYNLAIAYRGMGLLDEAVAEFQRAAKDPLRLFDCAGLLAQCFVEKGLPQLAVSWVERGLKVEGRSEEEYQELRYELAAALEASGEVERAFAVYVELYGENARLRDVAERVKQLGPGPASARTGTSGGSDVPPANVLPWKRG